MSNPDNLRRVCQFLKDAGTYYLATVEGDQPRVRPFGTAHIFEGRLYIQSGKVKNVAKQLAANPKAELCCFDGKRWLRLSGRLVEDDRLEARQSMLDAYPQLRKMYRATTATPSSIISPRRSPCSPPSPSRRKRCDCEGRGYSCLILLHRNARKTQ